MRNTTPALVCFLALASVDAEAAPKSAMEHFVESYDRLDANQFASALGRLGRDDHLMLSVYNQLASDIYLRACQIDGSLRFWIVGRNLGCQELFQSLQAAFHYGMTRQSFAQEVHTQRLQVLNAFRCSRGAIDAATCRVYAGGTQRMNDMSHDTSMRIIEAIGNQCRIGVDPGCWYR